MNLKSNPMARNQNIVIQNLKDEILIYDLIENKVFCLNKSVAMVWEKCDGLHDLFLIQHKLELETRQKIPAEMVVLAIDQLKKNGLLAGEEMGEVLRASSRREMIRKAALATAMALPVIFQLVAPMPTSAQSCVVPGGAAAGTPVNQFVDAGGCQFLLQGQCCSGSLTNYVFNPCCSFPLVEGTGICTGVCV
jgi:hypothetical protein